jgi:Tol biopolymer transport system component/DNA-binding SARP family transcriptional activator
MFLLTLFGSPRLEGPSGPLAGRSIQRRRLALLAALALERYRPIRRDKLLNYFWPDSDTDHARALLSDSIYVLRKELGEAAIIAGGDDIQLSSEVVRCDVGEFAKALASGQLEWAVDLYVGPLLDGFHIDDAPEFERRIDAERDRLGRAYARALEDLAVACETRSQSLDAVEWWQRLAVYDPASGRIARRLLQALDAAGDRAAALKFGRAHISLVREEFEMEPDNDVLDYMQQLQRASGHRHASEEIAAPSGATAKIGSPETEVSNISSHLSPSARGLPRWIAWLLGGALVAGGAVALTMTQRQSATIVIGKRTAVAIGPDLEVVPSISPDGETVCYTLTTPTTSKLFVQQVDGGSPVPVATQLSGRQEHGAFSPDGTHLLFHGPEGLYVMPALGGQARLIVGGTSWNDASWGSWAPDGKRIAYVQSDTVFIQSLDSTGRTALADGVDLHSTAWSRDGDWVAFVAGNSSFYDGNIAPSALRLVRAAGGPVMLLTDSLALNTSPIWVPGKRSLLFISDRDGGRDVYQMFLTRSGAPTGPPVRLTTGLNPERISISADGKRLAWSVLTRTANIWSLPIPARDSLPLSQAREETTGTQQVENFSISRDGQWLYYDSNRNGNQDIWRKPLVGGEPEMITSDRADDFQPAVSPDGREVAFHSMRTGNRDIFVVPAVGGPATRISTSTAQDNDVTWSPDGRALIWNSDEGGGSAWIARREDNGSWGSPTHLRLGPTKSLRMLRWSPDNHWIFFSDSAGMELWSPTAGDRRLLVHGVYAYFFAWSEDSRALYGLAFDRALDRVAIVAVAVADAKMRVLAYADNPRGQRYGSGFAVRNGRIYFTLTNDNSDIWVGAVTTK